MYNKTGEKIKGFAGFCAFCEISFCIIIALVLAFSAAMSSKEFSNPIWISYVLFLVSFVIGIVGSLLSWLKYLFFAGYGELISETAKTSELLGDIKDILSNTQSKAGDSTDVETVEEEK